MVDAFRRGLHLLYLLWVLLISDKQWRFVYGHGRLVEPPSRASMWRYGYDTPPNYLDNQLFCGGFTNQWEVHKGKCGVCGDPWQGPHEHEAGGKYARGIIVRRYQPNNTMRVVIDLTAPHKGWFQFKLCPINDPREKATHACFNKYKLKLADGSGSRYFVKSHVPGFHKITLQLPPGVQCSQCVLQWKYNAGNSWGVGSSGRGCVGCGPQEQFYGCADIAIGNQTLPPGVTLPYWRDEYEKYQTTPNFDMFTNKPPPLISRKRKPIIKKLFKLLRQYPTIDIKELVEVQLQNKISLISDGKKTWSEQGDRRTSTEDIDGEEEFLSHFEREGDIELTGGSTTSRAWSCSLPQALATTLLSLVVIYRR